MASVFPVVLALMGLHQDVSIHSETRRFTRPADMGEPREGTVRTPIIWGLPEPLQSRVQKAISFERVFAPGVPLEQSGAVGYDFADDYFIGKQVLSITLLLELMGAYPSTEPSQVNVDLTSGKVVTARTAFQKTAGLVAMAEAARKAAVARALKDATSEDREVIRSQVRGRFTAKDLTHFRVDENGVTFVYDYGFVHAVRSLEPDGKFRFSWARVKPYVRKKGPLGRFIVSGS